MAFNLTSSSPKGTLSGNLDPNTHSQAADRVLLLDPNAIRISDAPNRDPSAFDDESFEQLRSSIVAKGFNLQPILVRDTVNAGGVPGYELVFGERRLRACRELGAKVRALVTTTESTSEDALDRLRENRGRKDLSAFEFGQQIRFVLDGELGLTKSELAGRIGCSVALVSRAYELAGLPGEVVRAFQSPAEIRYEDIVPLRRAFAQNAGAVRQEAEKIKGESEPVAPREVMRRLVHASKGGDLHDANTPQDAPKRKLEVDGREIGEWRLSREGGVELHIATAMSDLQRAALLKHMSEYLARTVLGRRKDKSADKAASVGFTTDGTTT